MLSAHFHIMLFLVSSRLFSGRFMSCHLGILSFSIQPLKSCKQVYIGCSNVFKTNNAILTQVFLCCLEFLLLSLFLLIMFPMIPSFRFEVSRFLQVFSARKMIQFSEVVLGPLHLSRIVSIFSFVCQSVPSFFPSCSLKSEICKSVDQGTPPE